MTLDRDWRVEFLWWLSCFLALMAVLLPVAAGEGIYRALNTRGSNVDLLNVALGWTILQPVQILLAFWPFFASGALSARLLVGTFAGAKPRAVTSVFCTAAVVLGAWATTLDPTTTLVYGGAALVWALVLPLPPRDLLAYGEAGGGLIIGMSLAAMLNAFDFLLVAIIWCCWRLYRDHYTEVAVTASVVAILPMLTVADNPSGALVSASALYTTLETALLLCLGMAAVVLGQFIRPNDDEEATPTRGSTP
jgi:hypothetical protein